MHLVVYDIADNRRLQKIAKILESYGLTYSPRINAGDSGFKAMVADK
jgi:CRISPR-associated endonuclease Cas2